MSSIDEFEQGRRAFREVFDMVEELFSDMDKPVRKFASEAQRILKVAVGIVLPTIPFLEEESTMQLHDRETRIKGLKIDNTFILMRTGDFYEGVHIRRLSGLKIPGQTTEEIAEWLLNFIEVVAPSFGLAAEARKKRRTQLTERIERLKSS